MRNPPYICALDAAMDVIGGKWKALTLWALNDRLRRFGELRRSLPGVSEKVLAQQLRELEADGIVRRTVFDETPPRVKYELTDEGVALYAPLAALGEWAVRRMRDLDIVPSHGKE
ncbi:winged helix-turn-helix transcriptional regulator [Nonomuraea aridisoli]